MKSPLGTRALTRWLLPSFLLLLLCSYSGVQALSLGRAQAAVLLSRPLDMLVQASIEAQEETPLDRCFVAEVFYGESRVLAQYVSVSAQRQSSNALNLRVRASVPVDEPVVTVYLRTSCGPALARRYVLLSEALADTVAVVPVNPALIAPAAVVPATSNSPATSLPAVSGAQDNTTLVTTTRTRRDKTGKADKAASSPTRLRGSSDASAPVTSVKPARMAKLKTNAATDASSRQARLKLEPLDMTLPSEPILRSSQELQSQPSADTQTRALAADLWRSLNAQPEDILRDTQRLRNLEAQMQGMSKQTQSLAQELQTLRRSLEQAQSERYANGVVYFLLALLLAGAAWVAAMWWRKQQAKRASPWWDAEFNRPFPTSEQVGRQVSGQGEKGKGPNNKLVASLDRTGNFNQHLAPDSQPASNETKRSVRNSQMDRADDSSGPSSRPPGKRFGPIRHSEFATSEFGAPRLVNAEELFDVQQQADFFMSLGQTDQAIDILINHISDNVETSALAYLDLFDIYHRVDQSEPYEELREEFNRVFNTYVPAFADYGGESRGLDQYPYAISRIEALWPTQKVLEVIEESIFRKPGSTPDQTFDLVAYRELMLLYAIAKEISEHESVMLDFDLTAAPSLPDALPAALVDLSQPLDFDLPSIELPK